MTTQLSDLLAHVEAIREQADRATKGPWEYGSVSLTNWHDNTFEMEWVPNGNGEPGDPVNENEKNDGAFIASARTSVPALCDLVTAQARYIAWMRGEIPGTERYEDSAPAQLEAALTAFLEAAR